MINFNVLLKSYNQYMNESNKVPNCIALFIAMPSGEIETIINPNVKAKIDYISKTYSEDLIHKNCDKIKIVGFGIGDDFKSISDMMNNFVEYSDDLEVNPSDDNEDDVLDTIVVISDEVILKNGYLELK